MKLFLTVVLASVLMMKTAEGAALDSGVACPLATDTCPIDEECKADTDATDKCLPCAANYVKPTATDKACKLADFQKCTEAALCSGGKCDSTYNRCGLANDAACTGNMNCASGNCMLTETDSVVTQKCADAGAAGVVTSVLLMVATLMTSRIL